MQPARPADGSNRPVVLQDVHAVEIAVRLLRGRGLFRGPMSFVNAIDRPNCADLSPPVSLPATFRVPDFMNPVHGTDTAKRHAVVGTIPGIVGVALTGWLVDTTGSYDSVFLMVAGANLVGVIVWLLFAKGEKLVD